MKENEKLKIGDIVRLKSGGPQMTVNGFREFDGHVHCQWFANKKLNNGYFEAAALIDADEGADVDD